MQLAEGQLRLNPMGGVAGMDLPAVIAVVTALGIDARVAWLLAPFHEQGVVAGIHERMRRPEG